MNSFNTPFRRLLEIRNSPLPVWWIGRLILVIMFASACSFSGCVSTPGTEKGPEGTIVHYIEVESNQPARIEVNSDALGNTPLKLKVFADKDGTFHNFGNSDYVIQAFPTTTNGVPQTKV